MMRCAICRTRLSLTAHADWEGGICNACWRRSNPITRGYFALCQELGEEVGWTDRYVMENNILWDLIVAQIRQSINPPPPREERDKRRPKIDFSKVGRPRAAVLMRERHRRSGRR